MPLTFAVKLEFVLKALSMTRGQLAASLRVDKSIVGRWVTGAVKPSAHNLSKLTALVAERVGGFTILDWDRDLDNLASVLGVEANMPGVAAFGAGEGLKLLLLDQVMATTAKRANAYEGFFRSTRPYAQAPGRFLHDQMMIRRHECGLLRFEMSTAGVSTVGWLLPLRDQLFVIGAELTSDSFVFGILNGVNTLRAGAVDGLLLNCALDIGRTPTACAAIFERVGDLTDDDAADDLRFTEMAKSEALAPEGSVPEAIARHLIRDVGAASLAMGGDWLLRLPLARSMSGGMPVV
ncbi:MAG: hypothetical protein ACR2F8_05670 [Caulobacteraceae bacterium]